MPPAVGRRSRRSPGRNLLDTDTLTHLQAGHTRVAQRLRENADPEVAITIISRIEMLRGRFDFVMKAANATELIRAQELLVRTEAFLARLLVVRPGRSRRG
jgi:tRNA(fMet)-specific endonuclease VapC